MPDRSPWLTIISAIALAFATYDTSIYRIILAFGGVTFGLLLSDWIPDKRRQWIDRKQRT